MILKQDMARFVLAKASEFGKFTIGHQRFPHLCATDILNRFNAIQEMYHMVSAHFNPGTVPLVGTIVSLGSL